MKRRVSMFRSQGESTLFAVVGAACDVPNPSLVHSAWEIKQGETWLPDPQIKCIVVREAAPRIYFLGPLRRHDLFAGNYIRMPLDLGSRPAYQREGGGDIVRYDPKAKSWMLEADEGQMNLLGMYKAECNVPNPSDIGGRMWKLFDKENTKEWDYDPGFACYEGEMPPRQIFFTGGNRALAGVYTFRFLKLRNQRPSYQKDGSGWHVWWSSVTRHWVVANLGKQDLGGSCGWDGDLDVGKREEHTFKESGHMEDFAEAWSDEDVLHPAACTHWHFKARGWTGSCLMNTTKGIITKLEVAQQLGEKPVHCVPVTKPPSAIMVHKPEIKQVISGVYFLAENWNNNRCYYQKQCNLRKKDSWVVYYNPPSCKWYVDKTGLSGRRSTAAAYNVGDAPDPTLVTGKWLQRGTGGSWSSSGPFEITKTEDSPMQLFVHGVIEPDESEVGDAKQLPVNGLYCRREEDHQQRACYQKGTNNRFIIRFYAKTARWIIDGRRSTP